jgi:hypothetical protein
MSDTHLPEASASRSRGLALFSTFFASGLCFWD